MWAKAIKWLSLIAHPLLCHCGSFFKLFHLAYLMPPSLVSEGLALFNACRGSSLSYCTLHVACPHVSPGSRYPTRGGFHLLEHDSYICPHCSQLVSNSRMSLHSRKCTSGVVTQTQTSIQSFISNNMSINNQLGVTPLRKSIN